MLGKTEGNGRRKKNETLESREERRERHPKHCKPKTSPKINPVGWNAPT